MILAAGTNERGMLYAAYRVSDLVKAKADMTELDLLFQPKIAERYVSFGATTHGRRRYRPELYWETLNELPRFGYNGVLIYPGGGTPIGRHASPIVEAADGSIHWTKKTRRDGGNGWPGSSEGLVRMREVLFQYPKVTILEDDFWNNNLWPFDLPAMNYLPEDLRAKVSERNPFAMFQIGTDGEYYGGGSLPNANPDSRIRSANEALERGARMVIQRMDLHVRTPYGTAFGTMEIIPFAASKQLGEPTPPIEEIWREWAERRFGKTIRRGRHKGPFRRRD